MSKLFLIICLWCYTSFAAFAPLTFEEKCEKAVVIVMGKVEDIRPTKEFEKEILSGRSIAHFKISKTYKAPKGFPENILIPCDYIIQESPSDLTKGRRYIIFMYKMEKDNYYHPLDPACTHVLVDQKVATFGINLTFEHFKEKGSVLPVADFEANIKHELNWLESISELKVGLLKSKNLTVQSANKKEYMMSESERKSFSKILMEANWNKLNQNVEYTPSYFLKFHKHLLGIFVGEERGDFQIQWKNRTLLISEYEDAMFLKTLNQKLKIVPFK